jgi:hypothetical protein
VSCSEARSPEGNSSPLAFESSEPVARAPLAPPSGYVSPPAQFANPPPPAAYEDPINNPPKPLGDWRASPGWSTVQGDGCVEVNQGSSGERNLAVGNCQDSEKADDGNGY